MAHPLPPTPAGMSVILLFRIFKLPLAEFW